MLQHVERPNMDMAYAQLELLIPCRLNFFLIAQAITKYMLTCGIIMHFVSSCYCAECIQCCMMCTGKCLARG